MLNKKDYPTEFRNRQSLRLLQNSETTKSLLRLTQLKMDSEKKEIKSRIRGFTQHELQSLRDKSETNRPGTSFKGAFLNSNMLMLKEAEQRHRATKRGMMEATQKVFQGDKISLPKLNVEMHRTRQLRLQKTVSINELLQL